MAKRLDRCYNTIPLMIARTRRHDEQMDALEDHIKQVEDELYITDQAHVAMQSTIETVQDRARNLRERVEELEQERVWAQRRATEAERRIAEMEERIGSTSSLAIVCLLLAAAAVKGGAFLHR